MDEKHKNASGDIIKTYHKQQLEQLTNYFKPQEPWKDVVVVELDWLYLESVLGMYTTLTTLE